MLNHDNLLVLAAYLSALPEDYDDFNMAVFFTDRSLERVDVPVEQNYGRHNGGVGNCGAIACAVGHGPSAGLYVPETCFTISGRIDWLEYADHMFIKGYAREYGLTQRRAFEWMFGGGWSYIDNTPHGAAKRIRWLLANGLDAIPGPTNWPFCPQRHHLELYKDS